MQNYALRMAGSILEKLRVFFVKIWTKTEIVLNCDGRRVDFGKTEGKKRSESSLATLRNSWAVNLSRRRHGVDGEMATTREKEGSTTKRTTS